MTGNIFIDIYIIIAFVVIILSKIIKEKEKKEKKALKYIFSEDLIKKKAEKTAKLIDFISKVDKNLDMFFLKNRVKNVFLLFKKCWQKRDLTEVMPYISKHLYIQYTSQIDMMKKKHEINIIKNLEIISIYIVWLKYTIKEEDRFFTALITANAKDYYVDDRANKFLRGDEKTTIFQEFWTFRFDNGEWILYQIEQTRESDILRKDDFVEQFTDEQVNQILGKDSEKQGPKGPGIEEEIVIKKEKIARLINFLSEIDKIWDMSQMETIASLAFINVYNAMTELNPLKLDDNYISKIMKENLKKIFEINKFEGYTFEFRDLSIKKVNIVFVNNKIDNKEDEFVVRFSAQAQKKVILKKRIILEDKYVKPFIEYWTFKREDNKWKAFGVLPTEVGENAIYQENIDEESSPAQLEWYYSKKRTY